MKKPIVVVINDDSDFLEMMRLILKEELSCDVVLGHKGIDALDAISHHLPDLIILDVMMGTDPLAAEILESLRADSRLRQIPVIICSANTSFPQKNDRILRTLDSAIIQKPFHRADILKLIRTKLDSRQSSPSFPGFSSND